MKKFEGLFLSIGLILLFVGLVLYSIIPDKWYYAIPFASVGLVLTADWLFRNTEKVKTFLARPSTIYRGNSIVIAVIVLLIVSFLNAILYNHYKRWDLTANKLYSLSDASVKELKNLEKLIKEARENGDKNPFEIIFFVDTKNPAVKTRIEEIIEQYKYVLPDIKYQIADPDKNPVLAQQYNVKSYNIAVVRFKDRNVQVRDINENNLTNGIIKVTRGKKINVCFTTGHGEYDPDGMNQKRGASSFKKNLEDIGYKVKKITLAQYVKADDLKKDCSVVVIAGPQIEFYDQEMNVLDSYLSEKGRALVAIDPEYPASKLQTLMRKWGVIVEDSYVVDLNALSQIVGSGPLVPLGINYDQFHEITKGFQYMTLYPLARSLKKAEKVPNGVSVTQLVKTGDSSWADFNFVEDIKTKKRPVLSVGKDRKGPITIVMAVEGSLVKGSVEGDEKTRIVISGDSDFMSDGYFSVQSKGKESIQPNGDFTMNILNWLVHQKDLISIRPKERGTSQIILSATGERTITALTLVVMPLVFLAGGLAVFLRKRYR